MGYDILAVTLMFVSVTGAIAFIVLRDRVKRSDEAELARVWAAYARAQKLTFHDAEGQWPNRTLPRIVGSDLTISAVRIGDGIITRLEVRPRDTMLGRLCVTTGEPEADLPVVTSKDDELDTDVRVYAAPEALVARVLTRDVTRAFTAFRTGRALRFEFERGRVTLEWHEGELNGARIDEARRFARLVGTAVHAAFVAPSSAPE